MATEATTSYLLLGKLQQFTQSIAAGAIEDDHKERRIKFLEMYSQFVCLRTRGCLLPLQQKESDASSHPPFLLSSRNY